MSSGVIEKVDLGQCGEKRTTTTATTNKQSDFHLVHAKNSVGSGAGSGSGDFHVYRKHKRKEDERLAKLEDAEKSKLEKTSRRRVSLKCSIVVQPSCLI